MKALQFLNNECGHQLVSTFWCFCCPAMQEGHVHDEGHIHVFCRKCHIGVVGEISFVQSKNDSMPVESDEEGEGIWRDILEGVVYRDPLEAVIVTDSRLERVIPQMSRREVRRLFDQGAIRVDGVRVGADAVAVPGSVVQIGKRHWLRLVEASE